MKHLAFIICIVVLAGCGTPNPKPEATSAAYDQVKIGESRQKEFELPGPPWLVQPSGDYEHSQAPTWDIPDDPRGAGRWTVYFVGDNVVAVSSTNKTVTVTVGRYGTISEPTTDPR